MAVCKDRESAVSDPFGESLMLGIGLTRPSQRFCVGEFNLVVDRGLDRSGSDPLDTSIDSSVALSRLLDGCCVVDAWHSLHPEFKVFTWLRPDGTFASCIDLVGLLVVWSACAVVLSTGVPDVLGHGPGLWKLNVGR